MRRRLTMCFVAMCLTLVAGVLIARSYTVTGTVRDHESRDLRASVRLMAQLVSARQASGAEVDEAWLSGLAAPEHRVSLISESGTVTATGEGYGDGDDPLTAEATVDGDRLVLRESGDVAMRLAAPGWGTLIWLLVLVALIAAVAGYVASRLLLAPFVKLQAAAQQLTRGRFELDLPRTRIPEVVAVGRGLLAGAGQLQERIASEQAFAEHASHVLRTPLTGMRLDLEEIAARADLPADVREAAVRSVQRIETVDAVAGELVSLSRRGGLVSGAQVSLQDLASQSAQSWADALAEQHRPFSAAVEGQLDSTYTPGPVEHVLDLLLADTMTHGQGPVRLVFGTPGPGLLRIEVVRQPSEASAGMAAELPLAQARAVIGALGGRLRDDDPARLVVLLTRR